MERNHEGGFNFFWSESFVFLSRLTGLEIVLAILLTTLQCTPCLVGIVDTIVSLTDFFRTEPLWLKVSCGLCRAATDDFVLSAVDLFLYSVAGPGDDDGQALQV